MSKLKLSGGSTEKDLEFKKSQVNHLRLLLAWMRVEFTLDENMQRGIASAAKELVDAGLTTQEEAESLLARKESEIKRVPKYVRQGVKMLSKMLAEHDKSSQVVDGEIVSEVLGITKK